MNDLAVRPEQPMELSVDQLMSQVAKIQTIMAKVMKVNEHYGVIPGTTNGKPTLLKAGAEKLCFVFRLAPSFKGEDTPRDLGNGHREYIINCTLTHIPTGQVMGQGLGSCSTMEAKYRWRRAEPESTDKPVPKAYWNVRKENPAAAQEMLGGKDFVAHKIDGQWFICKKSGERIENPDLADQYNTILKMATKRAQVAATIVATAASDIFTQDLEDMHEGPQDASGSTNDGKSSPTPEPKLSTKKLSFKIALGQAILQYCENNKQKASAILEELTGKVTFTAVSEAEAEAAYKRFEMAYLQVGPDATDDIPMSWPTEHVTFQEGK